MARQCPRIFACVVGTTLFRARGPHHVCGFVHCRLTLLQVAAFACRKSMRQTPATECFDNGYHPPSQCAIPYVDNFHQTPTFLSPQSRRHGGASVFATAGFQAAGQVNPNVHATFSCQPHSTRFLPLFRQQGTNQQWGYLVRPRSIL